MKLYLAGPMRGIAKMNFPAFDTGTEILVALGHDVFSPAQRDRDHGLDVTGLTGKEHHDDYGFDLRAALADDLDFICRQADAVIVLPGWKASAGARAETATAAALGLGVWRLWEFHHSGSEARDATVPANSHTSDWDCTGRTHPA